LAARADAACLAKRSCFAYALAAAVEEKGFRPGMVSVVQTFGAGAKFHPHIHALSSRGGWAPSGE
jgi:acyl-CoA reductase-like NAD-dependent aldehyde dehydrogenase